MAKQTVGEHLNALRIRAGLSLQQVADLAGYKGPSSVQAYFSPHYDPDALQVKIAHRIAPVLAGRGDPEISEHEVYDLTKLPAPPSGIAQAVEVIPIAETPTLRGQPKDVPVYGTALAADLTFDDDADKLVEQTQFDMGEVINYVRRPPALGSATKVYALYVSGSSMEPRYRAGDPIFVDPQRPPMIGDDVVVQLFSENDDDPEVITGLIKTLTKRTSTIIALEQYHPAIQFSVAVERVARLHRVIPWREAFGL